MNLPILFVFLLVFAGCDTQKNQSLPVAPPTKPEVIPGDSDAAQAFIDRCQSCHGVQGEKSLDGAPFLAGQHEKYLANAMTAYVSDQRKHTQMKASLDSLTENDRYNLAAHFAKSNATWQRINIKRSKQENPQKIIDDLSKRGKIVPCASCHGKDGNSSNPGVPSLSVLEPEYIEIALQGYINGNRVDPFMTNFKLALTGVDIKSLAQYFARFKPKKTKLRSKGNPKAGEKAIKQCIGCHGVNGNSPVPSLPSLAGQNTKYLVTAMQAYKKGTRKNKLMRDAIKSLSDKTIQNIAAYYADQIPTKGIDKSVLISNFSPLVDGKLIAEVCNGCHGENGNSNEPGMPSLTQLHPEYLKNAINDYKNGDRQHELMTTLVSYLSEVEIAKVGLYYASQIPGKTKHIGTGDQQAARKIVGQCNSCHGTNGNSSKPKIPTLAGQDAIYLKSAIKGYRSGERTHEDMQNAVKELSKEDIENITSYYALQNPVSLKKRQLLSPQKLAKKCDRCHGKNGFSEDPLVPKLAGQVPQYIEQSLLAYQNDSRVHSTMNIMSKALSRVEINAIAEYYSIQNKQ